MSASAAVVDGRQRDAQARDARGPQERPSSSCRAHVSSAPAGRSPCTCSSTLVATRAALTNTTGDHPRGRGEVRRSDRRPQDEQHDHAHRDAHDETARQECEKLQHGPRPVEQQEVIDPERFGRLTATAMTSSVIHIASARATVRVVTFGVAWDDGDDERSRDQPEPDVPTGGVPSFPPESSPLWRRSTESGGPGSTFVPVSAGPALVAFPRPELLDHLAQAPGPALAGHSLLGEAHDTAARR